jgi:hypothetical protein
MLLPQVKPKIVRSRPTRLRWCLAESGLRIPRLPADESMVHRRSRTVSPDDTSLRSTFAAASLRPYPESSNSARRRRVQVVLRRGCVRRQVRFAQWFEGRRPAESLVRQAGRDLTRVCCWRGRQAGWSPSVADGVSLVVPVGSGLSYAWWLCGSEHSRSRSRNPNRYATAFTRQMGSTSGGSSDLALDGILTGAPQHLRLAAHAD